MRWIAILFVVLVLAALACSSETENGGDETPGQITSQVETPIASTEEVIKKHTDVVLPTIEPTLEPSSTPDLSTPFDELNLVSHACLPLNNE